MRRLRLMMLLPLGIVASVCASTSAAACDTKAWRDAIEHYTQQHPRAEAADLYKLVHQGIMGSEHAVSNAADADAWMQRELKTLSKAKVGEQMVEPLPPNGRFVRVNLRPFIAAGGDPTKLGDAFVATANGSKGDTTEFACVERSLANAERGDAMHRLVTVIRDRRTSGFDATHHSDAFEAAYAPAYRVVRATLAESLVARTRRPNE